MKKIFYLLTSLVVTGLLASHVIIASAHTADSGNNGTVKIHEGGSEDEPVINNEPHVCSFHVHFFYADPTQSGDWSIQSWEPTGNKSTVLSGSYDTTSTGEYKTSVYSLVNGHYQLNWEGRDDNNIKHKTFWVDCDNTVSPTQTVTPTETPTPTTTPEATPTCTPTPTDTVEEYTTPTPTPGNGGDYPTESPTPTEESQNPAPTDTPTPTTISESAVVTETPTPGVGGATNSSGSTTSSTNNEASILSTGASTSSAALLGASTMANTGSLTQNLMQFILIIGVALVGSSLLLYAQERKN